MHTLKLTKLWVSVADPGGGRGGHGPPGPVKIGHKKDGHQRRPHRFHVSQPPPLPGRWIRYWVSSMTKIKHKFTCISTYLCQLSDSLVLDFQIACSKIGEGEVLEASLRILLNFPEV